MSLWSSSKPAEWQAALDGVAETVRGLGRSSKQGAQLGTLDRWFHEQLPAALQKRDPPELTREELARLVEWKLTRGKWRPRLYEFAQALPPKDVEEASRAAFGLLAEAPSPAPLEVVRQAVDALTVLKGVGPATASAALEAFDPSVPFLSDEAQLAALGSKEYKMKEVLALTAALRKKAAQLSKAGGRQWTAKEVEMCLFASAVGGKGGASGSGGGKAGGGKQKKGAAGEAEAEPAGSKRRKT